MNANSAIITPVLAAGSTSSPYFYQVNISQMLCHSSCGAVTPVFNPTFTVLGFTPAGTGQYVATIHVDGVIAYVPCGADACCTKSQMLSQDFTIPIYSAAAITAVSVTPGTPTNVIAVSACQTCSRVFVSEIPLSVNVTTA